MTRRDFIKTAILMGAALAVPLPLGSKLLKAITPEQSQKLQQAAGQVQTFIRGFGQHGSIGAGLALVDVMNGRIIRIRPMWYDWKYPKYVPWTMTSHGMSFTPTMNSTPNYTAVGYKHRVYSPNRVMYPLMRADWTPTPNGKNRNQINRGTSPYVRITWDQALGYVCNEIARIKATYGSGAIMNY